MASSILDRVLGRPLATREERAQRVGPLAAIPALGLDALASAAYGPEAALTVLLPLGALGLVYAGPIVLLVIVLLAIVSMSYRQTIAASPGGGGTYRVSHKNLGPRAAVVAGTALAVDYVLNVAVAISAGIGAVVSAIPALGPHTLALCLGVLALLTIINLRGVDASARAFLAPTYLFVGSLALVIVVGVARTIASGGSPAPVVAPPAASAPALGAASLWLLARAFASGCTAMTGVEAVADAVPIFKEPQVKNAQRSLMATIAILIFLLAGVAILCRAYGIVATEPGTPGYRSVLSMLVAAVFGHGVVYDVAIAAILAVLALSANTSFADFPRLCHFLAVDGYLPCWFADRGRRLVYSTGIVVLAGLAAVLLIAFGGITDRLIPLFAVGAFLAFTMSQTAMVAHWRRERGHGARRAMAINAAGAIATGVTLVVIAVSKLTEGAWVIVVIVPLLCVGLLRIGARNRAIAAQIATIEPLAVPDARPPIVVVAARTWNRMIRDGLALALRLSDEVIAVQIVSEGVEPLTTNWELLVVAPARAAGVPAPQLDVVRSPFREFLTPFVDHVQRLSDAHPDRRVLVVIPDAVPKSRWENLLRDHRGALLEVLLRARCGDRVVVVRVPFHLRDVTPPPEPAATTR